LDEKTESVRVALPGIKTGRHSVSLKAVNDAGGETVVQKSISLEKTTAAEPAEELIVDDEPGEEPPVNAPKASAGSGT
jgi:hypothetical protein